MAKMDIVSGHENKVDNAIEISREMTKLLLLLDGLKEYFREKGSKIIGVDEKSIKFSGKNGLVTVTYPVKKRVKFQSNIDVSKLPAKLRKLFFNEVVKYEPVDNFEELAETNPEILNYVSMEFETARVTVPK